VWCPSDSLTQTGVILRLQQGRVKDGVPVGITPWRESRQAGAPDTKNPVPAKCGGVDGPHP
jgi:hypothetical protein